MKFLQNPLVSLFFITLVPISLYAQPPSFQKMEDTDLFRAKLLEASKNIKTLENDLTQEKHLDLLSEHAISKGHLYYKKENMLR